MHKDLTLPAGKTELLLVDLQEEHRLDQRYLVAGYPEVLGYARHLLDAARASGTTVCHTAYIRDFDVEPGGRRDIPIHQWMLSPTPTAFSIWWQKPLGIRKKSRLYELRDRNANATRPNVI